MRDLALLTFQTLDGVMQSPAMPDEDRTGGFEAGGWAQGCWPEVMEQVQRVAMAAPYDLLLGRSTYESFAQSFRDADASNPVAERLNRATKYVVGSATTPLRWQNSVLLKGEVVAEVARLKEQEGPLLQVHGSWQLVQTLLAHDLVDELRLWTFPVLVGAGKRLFGDRSRPSDLTLIQSESVPSGAVMGIYRRRP